MKRDKIKPRFENPFRCFYPTSDDWSPNFPRDTVEITIYTYHNPKVGVIPDGLIRIVVRGADDTMMAKDMRLPMAEYDAKIQELRYWVEHSLPNPLTKAWLRTQGFSFE